ncbi:hypothetical protein VNI00_002081 [Paramarasmius palmivorus]|uniref:Uncharacterized protein n=1 Tax=Paramarasmius palmivorus TaxID=297713 RepID=A0AAW0E3R7_9AGAR
MARTIEEIREANRKSAAKYRTKHLEATRQSARERMRRIRVEAIQRSTSNPPKFRGRKSTVPKRVNASSSSPKSQFKELHKMLKGTAEAIRYSQSKLKAFLPDNYNYNVLESLASSSHGMLVDLASAIEKAMEGAQETVLS